MPKNTMTPTEAKGVKAIRHLQKMADIDESVATALQGWRDMDAQMRKSTMETYKIFTADNVLPAAKIKADRLIKSAKEKISNRKIN
jgi:hypothetical protein